VVLDEIHAATDSVTPCRVANRVLKPISALHPPEFHQVDKLRWGEATARAAVDTPADRREFDPAPSRDACRKLGLKTRLNELIERFRAAPVVHSLNPEIMPVRAAARRSSRAATHLAGEADRVSAPINLDFS
jgi:hypothetical protein